jgi:hypothetical protein
MAVSRLRLIGNGHKDVFLPGLGRDPAVHGVVVRRGHYQRNTVQVSGFITTDPHRHGAGRFLIEYHGYHLRGNNPDAGPRLAQRLQLAGCNLAATHDQCGPFPHIYVQGKVWHGLSSGRQSILIGELTTYNLSPRNSTNGTILLAKLDREGARRVRPTAEVITAEFILDFFPGWYIIFKIKTSSKGDVCYVQ